MTELLSEAELSALYAALDALEDRLDDEDARDDDAIVDGILFGQRFAAVAARRLGDPAFLDRLTDGLRMIDGYEMSASAVFEVQRVLEALLPRAPVGPGVEALARSESPRVRRVVAGSVRLPEGSGVLRALATDAHRAVRTAARRRLGAEAPPPWVGALSADPATLVDPAALAEARPLLGEVLAWMHRWSDMGDNTLPSGIARLPEPLAVDLLARMYGSLREHELGGGGPVLASLLVHPRGVARAWETWSTSDDFRHRYLARSVLGVLPPERAADAALALVAEVVRAGHVEWADRGPSRAIDCACEAVEHGWPASADPQRLFEALPPVVAPATDVGSGPRGRLAKGLVRAADPHIAERLLAARVAGDEATALRVGSAFDDIVAVLSPERRAVAARQVLGAGVSVPWAIDVLLEDRTASDEERRRWLSDPELRASIVGRHPEPLRDLLRAELLAGTLSLEEAAHVMPHLPDDAEAWAVFRRQRAAAWDAGDRVDAAVLCWPKGAWTDADHAHALRLVEALESTPELARGLGMLVMMGLSKRADVGGLKERLLAVLSEPERAYFAPDD